MAMRLTQKLALAGAFVGLVGGLPAFAAQVDPADQAEWRQGYEEATNLAVPRSPVPMLPSDSAAATEALKFTSYMFTWDLRQYVRDLRSGNLDSGITANTRPERILEVVFGILRVIRTLILTATSGLGYRYPYIKGALVNTSTETLGLEPGEVVQVRSKEEIIATIDKDQKNRGLLFDSEMLPYCGGTYRVLRRVHHIIDEKTGKMLHMKYPCIILEGVACRSDFHRLCPRAIYHYWREGWLKRAPHVSVASAAEDMSEVCERR